MTLANCGERTLAGTAGPFAGNIPSATNRFILPTPASVSELIRTTTTMSGGTNGSNFRIGFINDAGVELTSANGHPASFQVVDTFGALTYSVNEERFSTNGRMNVGSLLAASPAALRTNTAGRTCDQVCGNLTRSCGDTSQYHAVVIPAFAASASSLALDVNGTARLLAWEERPTTARVARVMTLSNTMALDVAPGRRPVPIVPGSGGYEVLFDTDDEVFTRRFCGP